MPSVRKVPPPLIPDPIPQKFTRAQAIERLLAQGLTLAEIQAEEKQIGNSRLSWSGGGLRPLFTIAAL